MALSGWEETHEYGGSKMKKELVGSRFPVYPLTSTQREVWFHQLLHPGVPLYNIGGYTRIDGPIEPAFFEKALNRVIEENDALRITLVQAEGESLPLQQFSPHHHLNLELLDFSFEKNPHHKAIQWIHTEFVKPFSLYGQRMVRFALLKASDNCYYWFHVYHHLVVDGWSVSLLHRRVADAYNAFLKGSIPNKQKSCCYIDYIRDDHSYLKSEKYSLHETSWLNTFDRVPEPLLPHRYPYTDTYATEDKSSISSSKKAVLEMDWEFYHQLESKAKEMNGSLMHIFLAVFCVYFHRTTQKQDIIIGIPSLNRGTAAFKQTMGMFTGVSPVWLQPAVESRFSQLVKTIGRELRKVCTKRGGTNCLISPSPLKNGTFPCVSIIVPLNLSPCPTGLSSKPWPRPSKNTTVMVINRYTWNWITISEPSNPVK
jgi:hypothetical protein